MKRKKVSTAWLFEKDQSDAPIRLRIGVGPSRYPGKIKSWKGFLLSLVVVLAAAAIIGLIGLFR